MTERWAVEREGGQVPSGASKRKPLSQVTCVDAYGPWQTASL